MERDGIGLVAKPIEHHEPVRTKEPRLAVVEMQMRVHAMVEPRRAPLVPCLALRARPTPCAEALSLGPRDVRARDEARIGSLRRRLGDITEIPGAAAALPLEHRHPRPCLPSRPHRRPTDRLASHPLHHCPHHVRIRVRVRMRARVHVPSAPPVLHRPTHPAAPYSHHPHATQQSHPQPAPQPCAISGHPGPIAPPRPSVTLELPTPRFTVETASLQTESPFSFALTQRTMGPTMT